MAPQHDIERLIKSPSMAEASEDDGQRDSVEVAFALGSEVEAPPILPQDFLSGDKKPDKTKERCQKGSKGKQNTKKHAERPQNCPHLETALFFFGVAGMIISLVMLLLHYLRKITPYY